MEFSVDQFQVPLGRDDELVVFTEACLQRSFAVQRVGGIDEWHVVREKMPQRRHRGEAGQPLQFPQNQDKNQIYVPFVASTDVMPIQKFIDRPRSLHGVG